MDTTRPTLFPPRPTKVRWVLAFMDLDLHTPFRRWTLGWLRPGFRHVRAFRDTSHGLQVVQQTVARLQVEEIMPNETEATYSAWLVEEHGATIVAVEELVEETRWSLRGMSCVSVARSLLGWPAYPWQWWLTPSGLYRRLRRRQKWG